MSISTNDLNAAGKRNTAAIKLEHMPPPRTIWMRFTSNDGSAHVSEHVVWNKDLFLSRRADDAAAERARPDAGKGLAKAEQITEDQYKAER